MPALVTKYRIYFLSDSAAEQGGAHKPHLVPVDVALEFNSHQEALVWAENILVSRGTFTILTVYRAT
ncbi:hypothetical protein [Hymenobacter sp.]|uniref:hypothetical protein n=1 Tax=Hymenobacter sp. TaxID=1898978 RepID=UPI00286CE01E|nr:hypothetical protein [Hymenobacter sp.]